MGYDQLDRVIYTGKWETSLDEDALREYFNNVDNKNSPSVDELPPGTVTRTFYDRMPARDTLGVELYPLGIVANPTYTLGRVAAVVSDVRAVLDDNGSAVQASDGSDSVIRVSTANSYDKYGRVLSSYAFDPTVPAGADSLRMLWSDTKYDLGGKVVSTTRNAYGLSFAGIVYRSVTERYTYDRLGRVDNIYSSQGYGNAPLAHYEYYPTGSVKSVNLGNSLTLAYTYHISGAVKTATVTSIGGDLLYSETLNYEDCGNGECTPQYNGNISRMAHQLAHGNTAYSENRNVTYYYDQLNRLASAEDIVENAFDEMFEYDAQGRIVSQRRAGNTSNTSGGEYAYESGSNRLKSVAAGMGGTADSRDMSNSDNFVYDQEGNLVEDKSKNMKITYDWRGMPVEFLRQTGCYDYHGLDLCDSTRLVIAYDASGRRISKTRMKESQNGTWWTELVTHYTGIGTEIRENPGNNEAKVVMNMPNGLGRYEPEDAAVPPSSSTSRTFEWYLKNHLGSTMLVYASGYGTPGVVRAAYDYRSFGEQIELTPPSTGKVTENFTGKEKDDETELNYFGARYLDPMLGMWTSVDPMRQFASPYLYAGNGVNPVNVVDPDGNAAIIDKDDNFVDVTIPVIYDGDAATYENIQTLQQEFLDIFVNEFDQYDVNVNFVTYNPDVHGKVYNYVYLSNSPVGDKCPGSPGGCAGTGSLPGYAYIHFGDGSARVHELAHLLGLDDKYYQVDMFGKYFKAFDGYENNLMGSHDAKGIKPTQIEEMWGPGLHSETRRNGYRANTINGL